MEVIIEIAEAGQRARRYQKVCLPELTIGRGWDNDVIINDPEVDAHHLTIHFDESNESADSFEVLDLNSTNGSVIKRKTLSGADMPCHFGEAIQLGQSIIKVHRPGDPVSPTHKHRAHNFPLKHFESTAISFVLICAAIFFGPTKSVYLAPVDFDWVELLKESLANCLMLLTITACLATLSKLIKDNYFFWQHLRLVCLVVLLGNFTQPLVNWVSFNLLSSSLKSILETLIPSLLLVLWLLPALYLCTNFKINLRRIIAGAAVVIFAAFSYVFPSLEDEDNYWNSYRPDLITTTLPPGRLLVGSISKEELLLETKLAFKRAEEIAIEDREKDD